MTASPQEQDVLRDWRARSYAHSSIFWTSANELAVFDPDIAQQINTLNFRNLTLPDKLGDLLRGRTSPPFFWKQVRAVWIAQMRHLSNPEGIEQLTARMIDLIEERLDHQGDLVWLAQEVVSQSLIPTVVAGLNPTDTARIIRDQNLKINNLLITKAQRVTLKQQFRIFFTQVSAGLVVRRELRRRASGSKPRQPDLTDPIVDLLPELGMDRAVDAVTGVLTAIAGPPGSAGACLLYALTHQPDWAERLADELGQIPLSEFYAAPTRAAPATHRFVKETLRMWSPTPLMDRLVRTEIKHAEICLKEGQTYLLSPDIIHHNPQYWKDPDSFNPDRWLHQIEHRPGAGACYVPFGWAPSACIGASLGTIQLMVLCYLMCTRYRIKPAEPQKIRMALVSVPLPQNFHGTITRR